MCENLDTGKARSPCDASELATYGHALIPKASLEKRRGRTGVTQTGSCRRRPSVPTDGSRAGAQIAGAQMAKRLPAMRTPGFDPWVGKIPWRRKWQPTPEFLPRKFHGWRSLVGYSPWGHKELDMIDRPHFHFLCRRECGRVMQSAESHKTQGEMEAVFLERWKTMNGLYPLF